MVRRRNSDSKDNGTVRQHTANNGLQRWTQLKHTRQGMMHRFEKYASMTIPKVCLPDNVDENSNSIQHDWTSVGAQAVNHLTNKLVLALFAPGVPFFRLDAGDKLLEKLQVDQDNMRNMLVKGEQKALQVMDQRAVRPHINELCRSLVVVGNSLLDLLDDDNPRVIGIKNYCVKRSLTGKVMEIVHYEKVLFDELDDDAQAVCKRGHGQDVYVEHVRWFKLAKKKWTMEVSVDGTTLPATFSQSWPEDTFQLYPVTWDRAGTNNYGTGLVEDYAGDFGALSTLSEAEMKAAILASDFRWLANPAGVSDIEEFKDSQTGDVIPGVVDDLQLVAHVSTNALQQIGGSVDRVINRIGRGFLMASAATRDAERVTAEEIRLQAQELETSLGGVYSRLAIDLQLPVSRWLLKQIDVSLKGTDLTPTIVTGLAALSRNAEAQQLSMFLSQAAGVGQMPEHILKYLKMSAIFSTMASAYGISATDYVFTQEEVSQADAAAQQQQQEAMAQQEAAKAGAQSMAQQGNEQ